MPPKTGEHPLFLNSYMFIYYSLRFLDEKHPAFFLSSYLLPIIALQLSESDKLKFLARLSTDDFLTFDYSYIACSTTAPFFLTIAPT